MSSAPPVVTPTRPKTRPTEQTRLLPPFNVILLNDDDHSFDFVVHVLREVFRIQLERAFQLTMEAHEKGRSIVWTGTKEVGELKVDQIRTFHETRERDGKDLGPLGCELEPAPG